MAYLSFTERWAGTKCHILRRREEREGAEKREGKEAERKDRERGSVRYGAGRGGFSLCDPAVTPARGQLFAIPPRPI